MASLKEVRNRIVSVNSTKQITAAMKMVSAAKLRRAQDAIIRMRPYAEKLQAILSNVSASLDSSEGKFSAQREVKNVLFVAVVSNRGLAGAFNTQVFRLIRKAAAEAEAKGQKVTVLPIGKKAMDAYRRTAYFNTALPTDLAHLYDGISFDKVAPVAELIMDRFADGSYDKVVIFYNKFKNAAMQRKATCPCCQQPPTRTPRLPRWITSWSLIARRSWRASFRKASRSNSTKPCSIATPANTVPA